MKLSELRQRLEAGETINYPPWAFSATQMRCENCDSDIECCGDGFGSVADALETIILFTGWNLDLLDEYNRKAL